MSLAFYAYPIKNDNEEINNIKNNKYKNRTVKNANKERNEKINAAMVRSTYMDDDSESTGLADFNEQGLDVNPELSQEQPQIEQAKYWVPQEIGTQNVEKNSKNDVSISPSAYNELKSTSVDDYYRQYIPGSSSNTDSNELLKKLDNILYLLEEQQVEKNTYVVEELILYVFLGIFIIYVLDSFVRVGKYTR